MLFQYVKWITKLPQRSESELSVYNQTWHAVKTFSLLNILTYIAVSYVLTCMYLWWEKLHSCFTGEWFDKNNSGMHHTDINFMLVNYISFHQYASLCWNFIKSGQEDIFFICEILVIMSALQPFPKISKTPYVKSRRKCQKQK